MTGIFWNSSERRLRAGWRLFIFALLGLGLAVVGEIVGPPEVGNFYTNLVAAELVGLAVALFAVGLLGRFLDHRRFVDFGLDLNRRWWTDLGFGFVLGGVMLAAIFGGELAAGWIQLRDPSARAGNTFSFVILLAQVACFACVSLTEELLCRGYLLRNLAEGLNVSRLGPRAALWLSAMVSAVVFALLHGGNEGASVISTVNIAVAGLLLALPVLLTGSLGLSLGLHFAWNLFEGPVFGFQVSGRNVGQTFFDIVQKGPVFWTGGAFGPEGGLLAILASIGGGALVVGWVRWTRGHVQPLSRVAEYQRPPAPMETVMDPMA